MTAKEVGNTGIKSGSSSQVFVTPKQVEIAISFRIIDWLALEDAKRVGAEKTIFFRFVASLLSHFVGLEGPEIRIKWT